MQLSSHLRLSRHGVWCFRLVLPGPVAVVVGQREILKSLGTKRPEEARVKAHALSATLIPLCRTLRRILSIDPNSIDPKNVRELILKGYKREGSTVSIDHLETTRTDPLGMEVERRIVNAITSPDPEPLQISEAELAYVEQGKEEIRRLFGTKQPDIPEKLGDAIESFMKTKAGLAAASQKLYRSRLGVFAELIGPDRMVHAITAADCIRAKEALEARSAHASKRKAQPPQASGTKMVAKGSTANPGSSTKPSPKIGAGTIREFLTLWQDFFAWAIGSRRYLDDNPIEGIPRPSVGNNVGGAEPFSMGELQKIFDPAQFMTAKRPNQFWGPLIALFTGCRSNEIAQLRIKDIVIEDGIPCFNMVHEPNAKPPTQLKNSDSVRMLPIHPKLLEIGFQSYLDDLKAIGADRLFPNLPADKNGKREKYLSRDFNEGLLVRVGVHQTRTKVLHSFRDTVTATLVNKLHAAHIADWMGHAREGTESKHYIPEQTMQEKMEVTVPLLDFPNLNLAGISYQAGWWNEWLKRNMKP